MCQLLCVLHDLSLIGHSFPGVAFFVLLSPRSHSLVCFAVVLCVVHAISNSFFPKPQGLYTSFTLRYKYEFNQREKRHPQSSISSEWMVCLQVCQHVVDLHVQLRHGALAHRTIGDLTCPPEQHRRVDDLIALCVLTRYEVAGVEQRISAADTLEPAMYG